MKRSVDFNTNIGKRLRAVREAQGKTREKLAEQADISSQFLFEIETGKKGMTARTIVNLSQALHVSTDYLLLGDARSNLFNVLEGIPTDKQRLAEDFLKIFSRGAMPRLRSYA